MSSKKTTTTGRKYFGLFYKNRGKWTGPYKNIVLTAEQVPSYTRNVLPKHKSRLKSKTSFRRVQF